MGGGRYDSHRASRPHFDGASGESTSGRQARRSRPAVRVRISVQATAPHNVVRSHHDKRKRPRFRGPSLSPYQQEHQDLIASILAGDPINEARAVAESTLTGILGREATYSGQAITWDEAIRSRTRLGPAEDKFGPYPIPPVAMPGQYKFV